MIYHEFSAMNTDIVMAAEGRPERVAEGFSRAEELVRLQEQRFTRFSQDSELSALNRASGSWFAASPELFAVVRLAGEYHAGTGGLFNPGILNALCEAGYDRSMVEIRAAGGDLPPAAEAGQYSPPPFAEIELDQDGCAIRLPAGLTIDLGGIAKGWIAERAAHRLALYAQSCAVNAGGDMHAIGTPSGGGFWPVAVEDPFHPGTDVAALSVPAGAVATSTVTRRAWRQGGITRHHLIDPRTGHPAETPWISVTAIASQAALAEVLAKALLIAGPQGSAELIRRYPQAAFLVIDQSGQLFQSDNMRKYTHEHVG